MLRDEELKNGRRMDVFFPSGRKPLAGEIDLDERTFKTRSLEWQTNSASLDSLYLQDRVTAHAAHDDVLLLGCQWEQWTGPGGVWTGPPNRGTNYEYGTYEYAVFGVGAHELGGACIHGLQFKVPGWEGNPIFMDYPNSTPPRPDARLGESEYPRFRLPRYEPDAPTVAVAMAGEYAPPFEIPSLGCEVRLVRGSTVGWDSSIKHQPLVSVEFRSPKRIEDAWSAVRSITHFFTWIIGYAVAPEDVVYFNKPLPDTGTRRAIRGHFHVQGPQDPHAVVVRPPVYRTLNCLLQQGYDDRTTFSSVMRTWLERNTDESRNRANRLFLEIFRVHRYWETAVGILANAFDMLPQEDRRPRQRGGTRKGRQKNERSDVLLDRLEVVVEHAQLSDADAEATRQKLRKAREVRNSYTHGPNNHDKRPVPEPYSKSEVEELTSVMACIYGMSQLYECGLPPQAVGLMGHGLNPLVESHPNV